MPIRSPSAVIHSVHFYDGDEALIQRLDNVISASLEAGNSVLIVATDVHRRQLCAALKKRSLSFEGSGLLSLFDAQETLVHFMVNGTPDRERFFDWVGDMILTAKQAPCNGTRGLTVFGEMVAVLWQEGNKDGALQLEALWNDLLNDRAFHLHCAYPKVLFQNNAGSLAMQSICERHSHVVGHAA